MSLEEIRREIDGIDRQLIDLFIKRMDAAGEVARIKRENGQPVYHAGREKEILDRVSAESGKYASGARLVFQALMDASRAYQYRLMPQEGTLSGVIDGAAEEYPELHPGTCIACPGVWGSYSHAAVNRLFLDCKPVFYERFGEVFDAVEKGQCEFGVLPMENSSAGAVTEVYDLLVKHRFYIVDSMELPISHCLMAQEGVELSDIQEVYSHPQGLSQCSDFLTEHHMTPVSWSNTAVAAQMVAQSGRRDIAAIASRTAADEYGLAILHDHPQNNSNNCTRFIVISKRCIIPKNASKISMVFALPHETGSLYRVLSRFAANGLNLTKLESRPIQGTSFEYFFYLDFIGSVRDDVTRSILCGISSDLPQFAFLGNYAEKAIQSENGQRSR